MASVSGAVWLRVTTIGGGGGGAVDGLAGCCRTSRAAAELQALSQAWEGRGLAAGGTCKTDPAG